MPLAHLRHALLPVLVCVVASCTEKADECESAYRNKEFAVAVPACRGALEKGTAHSAARLAESLYRTADWVALERLAENAPAEVLYWAGSGFRKQEKLGAAANTYQEAFRKADALNSLLAAKAAYQIGNLAYASSDLSVAVRWANKSRHKARLAKDRRLESMALRQMFTILFELGDYRAASHALGLASEITDQSGIPWAYILFNRALVYWANNDFQLARDTWLKSLRFAAPTKDRYFLAMVHQNLAEVSVFLNEISEATRHLDKALEFGDDPEKSSVSYFQALIAREKGDLAEAQKGLVGALGKKLDRDWKWQLEHLSGTVHERSGDFRAAEKMYEQAISSIEAFRSAFARPEPKSSLTNARRNPYADLVEIRMGRGDVANAFQTTERAREQVFLKGLSKSSELTEDADEFDKLVESSADRASYIASLSTALRTEGLRTSPTSYKAGENEVLVFFEGRDVFWRFYEEGGQLVGDSVALDKKTLTKLSRQFLATPGDKSLASRLGAALVPASLVRRTEKPLHIVVDGVLGRIPFAALRLEHSFLIQQRPLSFSPSVASLNRVREPSDTSPPIVVGDPGSDLPAARSEAHAVGKKLGVQSLVGTDATALALSSAQAPSVVHFAGHSGWSAKGAWMALGDRRVFASDILGWAANPRVAVIASCASGARAGRGMWGSIGAAFLAGGAHAVVSSLWSVDDEPTREFVMSFYEARGDKEPVLAVAKAQRRSIELNVPTSTWASFVVFGN